MSFAISSFQNKVEAQYAILLVEAGLLDKIKKAVKKATLALVGVGLFSNTAAAFTGTGMKKYAAEATKIFQEAGIDCSVDAKITNQAGKHLAILTYKCSDGSSSIIKILKAGDAFSFLDMKMYKNSDGVVNPEIEGVAMSMTAQLREDLDKAQLDR